MRNFVLILNLALLLTPTLLTPTAAAWKEAWDRYEFENDEADQSQSPTRLGGQTTLYNFRPPAISVEDELHDQNERDRLSPSFYNGRHGDDDPTKMSPPPPLGNNEEKWGGEENFAPPPPPQDRPDDNQNPALMPRVRPPVEMSPEDQVRFYETFRIYNFRGSGTQIERDDDDFQNPAMTTTTTTPAPETEKPIKGRNVPLYNKFRPYNSRKKVDGTTTQPPVTMETTKAYETTISTTTTTTTEAPTTLATTLATTRRTKVRVYNNFRPNRKKMVTTTTTQSTFSNGDGHDSDTISTTTPPPTVEATSTTHRATTTRGPGHSCQPQTPQAASVDDDGDGTSEAATVKHSILTELESPEKSTPRPIRIIERFCRRICS